MNLKELIAFYESKLENPDLTRGSRKVATLTLMELRRAERLNELARAGYKMNRHNLQDDEPNTERVHLYMDDTETQQFFLGDNMFYELTIDKMIRHKWPEEKPEEEKEYLIRTEFTDDNQEDVYEACMVAEWQENELDREWYSQDFKPGFYMQDDNDMWCHVDFVTHWWNLPEVE